MRWRPRNLELFVAESAQARDVAAQIAALSASWAGGDRESAALRAECEERLRALRALWRVRRDLFGERELTTLRDLAAALRGNGGGLAAAVGVGGAPAEASARAREILRDTFGHETYRPGQEAIISAVLAGRDCIGVMPTGAGKSLTYQVPARLLGGTVLVVSPLIALMKDQVDAMARIGVRATFLNSSVDPEERRSRVQRARRGELELLYAAPEGLEASVGAALEGVRLSLIAVDEAHCISQWGHDFRPAYRNLRGLKERFGGIPVLALTATATPDVTRDIAEQLGMEDPFLHRGTFFRRNLRLHAYRKGDGRSHGVARARHGLRTRDALLRLVRARPDESGIVYCLSRRSVDAAAELLRRHGVRALAYHAGMEPDERARTQDAFHEGRAHVIVATVAFGMGIDKPDIRYVVHRDMPRSIEGYYQEIGRAGRDGAPSDCVLFYSWADVAGWDRLVDGADPALAAVQRGQARAMFRLAEDATCRHQSLVRHFGEHMDACGSSCDLCAGTDLVTDVGRRPRGAAASDRRTPPGITWDAGLFEELRALRKQLAAADGVPAFCVFTDAVLRELATACPQDDRSFAAVPGVGPKKLVRYGPAFLTRLRGRSS